jgi:hypothetical protein
MAAYDFGYGAQARGGPGAYGYRPNLYVSNPFAGWNPSELDFDYYQNNPTAVAAKWLSANPAGQQPASLRAFLQQWMPQAYQQYQAQVPQNPELGYADWLGRQDMVGEYEKTNPSAQGLRAGYRTRYLTR